MKQIIVFVLLTLWAMPRPDKARVFVKFVDGSEG